jgi:hypothetical protein
MRESQFLCLAVSRRDGGNCIAGIDLDSGKWIRPVHTKNRGALGDHEIVVRDSATKNLRMLATLDVLRLGFERYVGDRVQPENWELAAPSNESTYVVLRRFDGPKDLETLISRLENNAPLLHSYSNKIQAVDLFVSQLSHSLSIIRPEMPHWRISPHPRYPNKLRVEADFRFRGDSYCLVVTDPIWEARCAHHRAGRYPHSDLAEDANGNLLLTISLAEVPLNGYHYKLVAGVIQLPALSAL